MNLLLAAFLLAMAAHTNPDLEALRWHNRVLLLFAPSTSDGSLREQEQRLDSDRKGLEERDLKVFVVTGENRLLRDKFHVQGSEFMLVLIGKDGGEKWRAQHPVEPDKIYDVIDKMPMRRDEMSRGK